MKNDILKYFEEEEFRAYQEEIILNIFNAFNDGAEIVIAELPWGIGKTVIAKTFANYFAKAFLLTKSKGLQRQIIDKYFDSIEIKGRNNFLCRKNYAVKASEGDCIFNKEEKCQHSPIRDAEDELLEHTTGARTLYYDYEQLCDYWKQKVDGINSKIAVHNYDYYLTESNFVGNILPKQSLIQNDDMKQSLIGIFDEAHNIGETLLSLISISLSHAQLDRIGLILPDHGNDVTEWIEWLTVFKSRILPDKKEELNESKTSVGSKEEIRDTDYLILKVDSMMRNVSFFLSAFKSNPKGWIFSPEYEMYGSSIRTINILPVFAAPFTNQYLFKNFNKMLMMSSTILSPKLFANDLGMKGKKLAYVTAPCPFPLKNRPIYLMNIASMGYNADKNYVDTILMPTIAFAIDLILKEFKNKRGVIHSRSFAINNAIYNNSTNKERIITHKGTEEKSYMDALEEFKLTEQPDSVISSPSITEGVDFPGTEAEFQIIAKLYYDSIVDNPQLKQRKEVDPDYYEWLSVIKLIQASGRAIRGPNDISPVFLLDSRAEWYIYKNKEFIPKWWKDAIKYPPHQYSYITNIVKDKFNRGT